jgi:hypothetical protein
VLMFVSSDFWHLIHNLFWFLEGVSMIVLSSLLKEDYNA